MSTEKLQDLEVEEIEEVNQKQKKKGFKLLPYLRTFRRKAILIAVMTGLTTSVAFLFSLRDTNTYYGNFQILIEPITSEGKLTETSTIIRTSGVPNDELFTQDYPTLIKILKSPSMMNKIAKDIQDKFPSVNVAVIKKNLLNALKVQRIGQTRNDQTKIIDVSYNGTEPEVVQLVLEVVAENYLKYSNNERQRKIQAGVQFIDEQIPGLQERVNELRSQQQKIQQEYDLINPNIKGQELFTLLDQLTFQKIETERQLKQQKTLKSNIEKQLNLTPEESLAASDISQNPDRQALLTQLQEIESQIALESARFTSNTPNLKVLEEKRNNLIALLNEETQKILKEYSNSLSNNSSIRKFQNPIRMNLIQKLIETETQIQMLEVGYRSLMESITALEKQARQFPEIIQQYNELERDLSVTSKILDQLLTQRETLKVESAQNQIPWELIAPPEIPLNALGKPMAIPPDPKKKLIAGFATGMLLGMGIAIVLEKRQDIFFEPEDIQDFLSMPLLGKIPLNDSNIQQADSQSEGEEENFAEDQGDIQEKNNDFVFTKAFDSLYAKLFFMYPDPPIRSILVSSVEPEDGQSTIALNLAKRAAEEGKRVLLVDANLKKPQIHTWLDLDNYKGLINLLAHQSNPEEIIQKAKLNDHLFVLTTGMYLPENSQRVWSMKMQELMKEFEAKYDLVIYDPPHFLDSTDISFLAAHTDGILMVVGVAKTAQSKLKIALEQINTFSLPTLGVVANYVS